MKQVGLKKITGITFLIIYIVIIIIFLYFFFFYRLKDSSLWNSDTKFVGHALYGVDSIDYTNSYEALEVGYQNNITVMEADFLFTTDGELVLLHFWENSSSNRRTTFDTFMSSKIMGQYTPLDLKELLLIMEKYSDLYIIIDTKEESDSGNYSWGNVYRKIVEECREYNEELLDRFIVQLYDYDDYFVISKIYPFSSYIFSLYKMDVVSVEKIVYFCLLYHIDTISIPINYLSDGIVCEDDISFIKKKNIKIYVYTVNDYDIYQGLLDLGIDGVYTDFLH